MSQKPPRRTLSDILRANEMIGKKEENEKKKGKSGRWTRRKRTGKSLSQLLEGTKKIKLIKDGLEKSNRKLILGVIGNWMLFLLLCRENFQRRV